MNPYLITIHAEDRDEQIEAWRKFLESEMKARMDDLDSHDSANPEEKAMMSYDKGWLDACRLMHGMVVQMQLAREQNDD